METMARESTPAAIRVLAKAPGWVFVLAGLALIAAPVLVPPWLASQRVAYQHHVLEQRAEALTRQRERYDQFLSALEAADPLLLKRLAYEQLRMKPAHPENPPAEAPGGESVPGGGEQASRDSGGTQRLAADSPMVPVDAWLDRPLPRVGAGIEPYTPPRSRLVRLATGYTRWGMLGAGLLTLAAGLMATGASSEE
jgi:hypothetical protein